MDDLVLKILAFIVAIGLLVAVHEFGHFWVARRLGVRVLRFSIGFGRPLWRREAGPDRTEYVIAAIPLGGYVKMLDEHEGPVPPGEAHRAFNRQPLWRRLTGLIRRAAPGTLSGDPHWPAAVRSPAAGTVPLQYQRPYCSALALIRFPITFPYPCICGIMA